MMMESIQLLPGVWEGGGAGGGCGCKETAPRAVSAGKDSLYLD